MMILDPTNLVPFSPKQIKIYEIRQLCWKSFKNGRPTESLPERKCVMWRKRTFIHANFQIHRIILKSTVPRSLNSPRTTFAVSVVIGNIAKKIVTCSCACSARIMRSHRSGDWVKELCWRARRPSGCLREFWVYKYFSSTYYSMIDSTSLFPVPPCPANRSTRRKYRAGSATTTRAVSTRSVSQAFEIMKMVRQARAINAQLCSRMTILARSLRLVDRFMILIVSWLID